MANPKDPNSRGWYRKIGSPEELWEDWQKYKAECDSKIITKTEFSNKEARFVTAPVPTRISYTLVGLCAFIGISLVHFEKTYCKDPDYFDVIARIKTECEMDVRSKFETGELPPQIAALWMSRYGYSTKTDTNINGAVPVIEGSDGLSD